MAAIRLVTVLFLCAVLAVGAFSARSLAALSPSEACGAVLTRYEDVSCLPVDSCGAIRTSGMTYLTAQAAFRYADGPLPGTVRFRLGYRDDVTDVLGRCCALCQSERGTCGGFQVIGYGLRDSGCYTLTAGDCIAITSDAGFGLPLPANSRFAGSAFLCPSTLPPVATPACTSGKAFYLGESCTATTPTAADLYEGNILQLPSGVSLNPPLIEGPDGTFSAAPSTLGVGTYTYSLNARGEFGTISDSCEGTFSVQAAPVSTPVCNSVATFVASASSCAVDPPPTAEELLVPGSLDPSSPGLAVTIIRNSPFIINPTSLLVGGTYSYTLTASKCGVSSNPCAGTISVQAPQVPTPSCKANATFAADSGCARRAPSVAELLESAVVPSSAATALIITGGSPVTTSPSTLLVGSSYTYSLTASNCGVTSAACTGTIVIQDMESLDPNLIACPEVGATITPSAGAAFTTSYNGGGFKRNGCPVTVTIPSGPGGSAVTCDRCNKQGRHESPSCSATVSGKTLTVTGSGGNGNYLTWPVNVADASGASMSVTKTCGVCVQNNKGVCSANWVAGTTTPGC